MTAPDPDGRPEASFDDFVRERGRALWRAAWLLTGDAHRAEDLVQTALARTYPRFAAVSASGSFEAYVRRTLYTAFVSWRGRRWCGEVPVDGVGEAVAGEQADADGHLVVARALAALPRAQRAVVVLRYFEDRTEADTAALLGVSVGTVKSHHARALRALRVSPHLVDEEDR